MEFEPGTKVIIASSLMEKQVVHFEINKYWRERTKYCDAVVTIRKVSDRTSLDVFYEIEEDDTMTD